MDVEELADQLLNLGVIDGKGEFILNLDTGASISPRARAIELLTEFSSHVRADERKSPRQQVLLPALEKALAESKQATEDVYKDYQDAVKRLHAAEAEIAALKEPMACGRPGHMKSGGTDAHGGCLACMDRAEQIHKTCEHGDGCKAREAEIANLKLQLAERDGMPAVGFYPESGLCVWKQTALDAYVQERVTQEHQNHAQMMADLYSTMIDPCAEGSMKEAEMFEALMAAARENREYLHDRNAYVQEKVDYERGEIAAKLDLVADGYKAGGHSHRAQMLHALAGEIRAKVKAVDPPKESQ